MGVLYVVRNLIALKIWLDATYVYQFIFYHLIDFSLGFLLFHIHKNYFQKYIVTPVQSILFSILAFVPFLGLLRWYSQGFYINHLLRIWSLFLISSSAMLCFPIMRLFSCKLLVCLGRLSYSIYLLNLPILCMIGYYNPFPTYPIANALLAWFILIVTSSLTYTYEEFGISLGRKF